MALTKVFIDTSWFKAFADPEDDFHQLAKNQFSKMQVSKTKLITTNYILDESFTLIRVRIDLKSAMDFRQMLASMSDMLKIIRILSQDDAKSWDWFPKNWSKLSFTDCTSFAVMHRLGLKDVATFDDHFSRAGFNVLS